MSTDGSAGDSSASSDVRVFRTDIQSEMQTSYLTYAMSVIISRALPDVRDGHAAEQPSKRPVAAAEG
ncbi:MAG: hypothetical protein ACKPJJ_00905, partial [Planctomycetaceae bacterium]